MSRLQDDEEAYENARRVLWALKDSRRALWEQQSAPELTQTSSTLEELISRLSDGLALPSLHHGLQKLADDILTAVIDICVYETVVQVARHTHKWGSDVLCACGKRADEQRMNLALTSKRFHRIVMSTPSVWSYIDRSPVLNWVRISENSKSAPLFLSIETQIDGEPDQASEETLTNIKFDRVHEMFISLSYDEWLKGKDIFPAMAPLIPDSLENPLITDGARRSPSLLDWSLSKMRILTTMECIPPAHFLGGITNLFISISYLRSVEGWDNEPRAAVMYDVLDALRSAKALQQLTIVYGRAAVRSTIGTPMRTRPEAVELPSLTHLSIMAQTDRFVFATMDIITNAMKVSKLHSLTLQLETLTTQPQEDQHLFAAYSILDTVRVLKLSVTHNPRRITSFIGHRSTTQSTDYARQNEGYIRKFLCRLPSLAELTIVTTHGRDTPPICYIEDCPNLKCFRYDGPFFSREKAFEGFVAHLRRIGTSTKLQFCSVLHMPFTTVTNKRELVRIDGMIGPIHLHWKDITEIDDDGRFCVDLVSRNSYQ